MSSPIEEERLNYRPPLPSMLRALCSLSMIEGEATSCCGDQEKIRSLFPLTFGRPLLSFKEGEACEAKPLRVGVVLSGGQAAGGHNVITGLYDALKKLNRECRLIGFLGGPSGIVENQTIELTDSLLARYRNTGGFDLIGSGRTKIERVEQLEAARAHVEELKLDGLVIIGGDDSNTNAALLAEYFLTHGCLCRVVGVPKTIDGDLKSEWIETSFGFDTACKTYAALIGNIARDALSAKKYYHFIKLMGRSASHVALECALQTHPNVVLIGEERLSLEEITAQLADVICQRAEMGKNYGLILIPEGLVEFVPEGVEGMLDAHGNVKVSQIETERLLIERVRAELGKRVDYCGKFDAVNHFFGYEGRSCFPSNFDANYCYALGFTAAALIHAGQTGHLAAVRHLNAPVEQWEPAGVPITRLMHMEERKEKLKPVIRKALVDLEGAPYKELTAHRTEWALEDHYRFPGPIQFYGPPELTECVTRTLELEQQAVKVS